MSTYAILAEESVSITELRKNPGSYFGDKPVAVLSNNKPAGYMVSQELFQEMLRLVEQAEIRRTVTGRLELSASKLREIGRQGWNRLAEGAPEDLEKLNQWSEY